MKIHLCSCLVIFGLLVMGCSESLPLDSGRWTGQGKAPAQPAGVDAQASALSIGSRQMVFQHQAVDGVEIEGAYYKELGSQFIAYKWARHVSLQLRSQIVLMKTQLPFIAEKFSRQHPQYDKRDLVQKPSLVIRNGKIEWKLIYQKPDGFLEGVFADRNLMIVESKILGSHIDTPSATLFPDGPLKSQLQRVLLAELMGNQLLISPRIRVVTQSPLKAEAENSQFLYPVEDQRFEQVQVFFYLTKTLHWCESELKFKLPFALEAETSVGFPEKTNAAFYYQHKIRLGDGDDDVFSRIPLDPSIVVHESFHAVIEAVANLPYEGEGGSLNEGFADVLTALVLDNPKLGEASYKKAPFKRTVDNNLKLSEKTGGLYHDSGIVSGLLWSIEKSLGRQAAVPYLWETLLHLTPDSKFAELKLALNEAMKGLTGEQQLKVQDLLQQRGWSQ